MMNLCKAILENDGGEKLMNLSPELVKQFDLRYDDKPRLMTQKFQSSKRLLKIK